MLFYDWLMQQTERTDRVGDLARAAVNNPLFPRRVQFPESVIAWLQTHEGSSSLLIAAARDAAREFRATPASSS
jgi:uncharacterized protein YozE (UPF0346 family)